MIDQMSREELRLNLECGYADHENERVTPADEKAIP